MAITPGSRKTSGTQDELLFCNSDRQEVEKVKARLTERLERLAEKRKSLRGFYLYIGPVKMGVTYQLGLFLRFPREKSIA